MQTEKLQDMETLIIQREEEYLFQQFRMRDEAMSQFIEKRRLEDEKEAKIIRDRKEKFMREIKD